MFEQKIRKISHFFEQNANPRPTTMPLQQEHQAVPDLPPGSGRLSQGT
jgi:hypothetical protein